MSHHTRKKKTKNKKKKKKNFAYSKTKAQIGCAVVTEQLISAVVFALRIVPFLCYLCPKYASSVFLRQYRPVYIRHDRKPKLLIFSRDGSCNTCNMRSYTIMALNATKCKFGHSGVTVSTKSAHRRIIMY